jgi:hypothetical protein
VSENNVNYTNDSELWESQQRDFKILSVSVSPVLFDKNTSVFRTLCKLLRTESNTRTVLGLDVPLYEDWQDKNLQSIQELSKQQVDCVLCIASTIKSGALLARIKSHIGVSSLIRPKLTLLFNFAKNQRVSNVNLHIGVNVWLIRFEKSEDPKGDKIPEKASLSQLGVSEVDEISGPNQSEFGGSSNCPVGLTSEGSGAFRCTAYHLSLIHI